MSDSDVSFEAWPTDCADDDLHILRLSYLDGGLSATKLMEDGRYRRFSVNSDTTSDIALSVKILSYSKAEVFELLFPSVVAYRVLDEHSLTELWSLERPNHAMFRVKGHRWTQESPISFAFADDRSWMIVTDWDCVEVLTTEPPVIRSLGKATCEIVEDSHVDASDDDRVLAAPHILDGAKLTKTKRVL
ncbi:hypothetical protein CDQ92_11710 [Sphingopyxis bauzanensis]|uniref:Uncharacterized protein n=1 Tax=Sphingopyxis bauzanensis TaxID=651663 RepID=A0A246JR47_9SPHN|nr:hypothetical protein [Sphingopyxis bauzanensis]OWQ95485.1 hypothetical protein CDQ92_11710 [Sphingopyxis bauzanensis]GGJ62991.1 hypothetical protein GCM10011393_36490 [Sphingopyxis bauzanensis]